MLGRPEESYADDLYRFSWPEEAVEMVLERFGEVRDDISCELTVRSAHPVKGGTYVDGKRLLLIGPNSQRDMARRLEPHDRDLDWVGMLEQATTLARRRYRRGEPPTDLRTDPDPEARYLLRPLLIGGGITIWYGSEESAKSMLAMGVAAAVASGQEVAGLVSESSGPVLYLDWEDDANTHKERLRAVCAGAGLNVDTVPVWHQRMSASLHEASRDMRRLVAEIGAVLVVVDSIGMASGGDPADAAGIIKAMIGARALGVPVLGIHHLPKDSRDKSRPYGSVYAAAEARMTWLVEKDEDAPVGTMRVALTNKKSNRSIRHERQSFELRFQSSEDREALESVSITQLSFRESVTIGTGAGQKWRIAEAIGGAPKSLDDIAELTAISKAVVRAQLNRHKDMFAARDGLWGLLEAEPVTVGRNSSETARNSVTGPERNSTGPFRAPVTPGVTREEEEANPF